MNKKNFKAQASSSRALPSSFIPSSLGASAVFGSGFGGIPTSSLSYVYEPPDLSRVSNSNTVVALKNLQKKDATTKSKALEDLSSSLATIEQNSVGLDDSLIEAWVQLYPRTSVDNERRVRQNAHTLHGQIAVAAGKRLAKHMPVVVGAWLCGTYDNDKLVARSARESFTKVFSTSEKRIGVWKAYQSSILAYCENSICTETVQSLSDERTSSPDDAQAKYARVVGSGLSTLSDAFQILKTEDLDKEQSKWMELLRNDRLLGFATFSDAAVRRSLYRLLRSVLAMLPVTLDLPCISEYLVKSALDIDQIGSAPDYVQTLIAFTQSHPKIWTDHYKGVGKNSANRKLCKFLRRGTFGQSKTHWQQLSLLFQIIPQDVLTTPNSDAQHDQSAELPALVALREGIGKRENRRPSNAEAWSAYLAFCSRILSSISNAREVESICTDMILPLGTSYINPATTGSQWTVTGQQLKIAVDAMSIVHKYGNEALMTSLSDCSSGIIQDMQTSQPEQSKDYQSSQEAITSQARRWYSLLQELVADGGNADFSRRVADLVKDEAEAAINLLRSRRGKPYGGACSLEAASRHLNKLITSQETLQDLLNDFATKEVPSLMDSPSGPCLLRYLDNMKGSLGSDNIYDTGLKSLLRSSEPSNRLSVLVSLLAKPWPQDTDLRSLLKSSTEESVHSALNGGSSDWAPVQACVRNEDTPSDLISDILVSMVNGLSISHQQKSSLEGLDVVLKGRSAALQSQLASNIGTGLMTELLSVMQSQDDQTREHAAHVKSALESQLANGHESKEAESPMINIIRRGVADVGSYALPIDALLDQTRKILSDVPLEDRGDLLEKLLPDFPVWSQALAPFLLGPLDHSLALTNPLSGAAYLVQEPQSTGRTFPSAKEYDEDGLSSTMRIIIFTATLMKGNETSSQLSAIRTADAFEFLAISYQIISDHLNVPSTGPLWRVAGHDQRNSNPSLALEAQSTLGELLSNAASTSPPHVVQALHKLRESSQGLSYQAYYSARAYTALTVESTEHHGYTSDTGLDDRTTKMRRSEDTIADVSFLVARPESTASLKLFNELMSDAAGSSFNSNPSATLRRLVLLNAVAQTLMDSSEHIPQQRLVFFTKHVLSQLADNDLKAQQPILAETLRALNFVAPLIKDLYGEFWEDIVNALLSVLSSPESEIVTLHASLRLCSTLRSLAGDDEASEDLQDVWKEKQTSLGKALADLLVLQASLDDSNHQPLKLVNELLARSMTKGMVASPTDIDAILPVLASESMSLQKAAYPVMYEYISSQQEQISMDHALSKDSVPRIPEELLSLLIEVPDAADLMNLANQSDLPSPLYRYLLSWSLIFAHWNNASYAVRSAYVDSLKEGTYVKDLLDLTFDFLITQRPARSPSNPSKFSIQTYTLDSADNPDADAQWLASHLYYLTLLHLPGLAKNWWRNDCPRALEKRVEEFTSKHFSGLVVSAELAAVAAWDPNPDGATEMEVRANPRTREAVATYPVDDLHMAMKVVLPAAYPLQAASVATVKRVAADERRWQAWLSTATIAVNFNSSSQGVGAVIDGLVAWRKNVVAALKGHSECAICYSVVSPDGQLPAKRCGTCKNQFHGSCLFRWFKSSASSSCPLCRNPFNYG